MSNHTDHCNVEDILKRVSPKDTIDIWRQRTDQLIDRINSLYPCEKNLYVNQDVIIERNLFVKDSAVIDGDLIIKGSKTTVNTVDSTFKDNLIQLNYDQDDTGVWLGSDPNVLNRISGIEVNRGVVPSTGLATTQKLYWDEPTERWVIEGDLNVKGDTYSNENVLWRLNSNDIYYNTGNVGIGYHDPASLLHVVGSNSGDRLIALNLTNKHVNDSTQTAIRFSNSSDVDLLSAELASERQSDVSNDFWLKLRKDASTTPQVLTVKGATGNVGIGTTDPLQRLSVNFDEDNSSVEDLRTINGISLYNHDTTGSRPKSAMLFKTPGSAIGWVGERISGDSMNLHLTTESNLGLTDDGGNPLSTGIPKVTFTNAGAVGIGTTTPNSVFEIVRANPILTIRDTDTSVETVNAKLRLAESNPGDAVGNHWDIEYLISDLNFSYNGTPFMHIDYLGKVGIGTNGPTEKLHVDGGSLRVDIGTTPDSAAIFAGGGSNLHIDLDSGYSTFRNTAGDTDASGFHFKSINNDLVTIQNDGNVGIGTTEPSEKLEVEGAIKLSTSSNSTSELGTIRWTGSDYQGFMPTEVNGETVNDWISLTSGQGAQGVGGKWAGSTQNSSNIYYNTGNVGINWNNPLRKLHVNGDSLISGYLELSPTKINDLLKGGDNTPSFGHDIALSGNGKVLCVSDPSYGSIQTSLGIIYTYDWNGYTWIERENPLTGTPSFGSAISLNYDGSFLCVGAPYEDSVNSNNTTVQEGGLVYIYKINSSSLNWDYFETLNCLTNTSYQDVWNMYDRFGFSVSISGDGKTLVVGQPLYDAISSTATDPGKEADHGRMFIFERTSVSNQFGSFSAVIELKIDYYNNPYLEEHQEFSYKVCISHDGSAIWVLKKDNDPVASYYNVSKRLYLYNRGDGWTNSSSHTLWTSSAIDYGDHVFDSISCSHDGNIICLGDSSTNSVYIFDYAYVLNSHYIYLRQSLQFSDLEQSQSSINGVTDNRINFGKSVSISSDGGLLVVGSTTDVTGTSEGAVTTCSLRANKEPLHNKLHDGSGSILDSNGNIKFNTGIVSTILDTQRVLISDTTKKITSSSITQTELESLNNITGNIESRLNGLSSIWTITDEYDQIYSLSASDGLYTYDNVGINTNKPSLDFQVYGDSYIEKSYSLPKLSNNLSSLDSENFQSFGESMSISADNKVLVVGVPEYQRVDGDNTIYGCVKTYDWDGSSWVSRNFLLEGEITDITFGKSVAISGDGKILVVGSPTWESDNSQSTGKVEIYNLNETTLNWELFETIKYPRAADDNVSGAGVERDDLGYSLSISDDGLTLAVGAPDWKRTTKPFGKVYIFKRSSVNDIFDETNLLQEIWEYPLFISFQWYDGWDQSSESAMFGHAIALSGDGNTLVVCRRNNYDDPNAQGDDLGHFIITFKWDYSSQSFEYQDVLTEELIYDLDWGSNTLTDESTISSVSLSYNGAILSLSCKSSSVQQVDDMAVSPNAVDRMIDYDNSGFVKIYDNTLSVSSGFSYNHNIANNPSGPRSSQSFWIPRSSWPLTYHRNMNGEIYDQGQRVDQSSGWLNSGRMNFGMSSTLSSDGSMLLVSSLDSNSSNGLISTYSLSQNSKPLNQSNGLGFSTINDTITPNTDITMTSGSELKFTSTGGTHMRIGNNSSSDVTLMRVNATDISNDSGDYGFSVKYMGSRSGNDNSYSIWSDNQASGTQIEAFKINQDGKLYQGGVNEIYHTANYTPSPSKWPDAHATSGIYRDSKIGIGNFSSTALTEKLELRSTSGDSFIKITDTEATDDNDIGIIFEKTHTDQVDFKMFVRHNRFNLAWTNDILSNFTNPAWPTAYQFIPLDSAYSNAKPQHDFYGDLAVIGSGASSGNITATGDIESTSDIRIKENLEIIENPIEKIKELNGYTFNKNGEEKRSAGLVAQEVEKVLPEVVSENSDGIKSLAYGNILALLVETVKEQQKQIDELKKQISDK